MEIDPWAVRSADVLEEELTVLGGSWVAISRVKSRVISRVTKVLGIVSLLITLLIATHVPSSLDPLAS